MRALRGRRLDPRRPFHGLVAPVLERPREFDARSDRLAEATARLAELEEAHRALAAYCAATIETRDRLSERCERLEAEIAALGGAAA